MWLALVILIIAFLLISFRRIKGYDIPSYLVALISGGCILLIGSTTPERAFDFIDWDILGLLFGMMLMVAQLDKCGFFHLVASTLVKRYPNRTSFLCAVFVICSLLCTVVLNDALIMIFTPIAIIACARIKADPFPFVVAVFSAANIGCAATFIGAPHCALCASFANISFLEYTLISLPLVLICTFVQMLIFKHRFSSDLENDYIFDSEIIDEDVEVNLPIMYACLSVLLAMVVLFAVAEIIGIGLGIVSVVGGLVQLSIVTVSEPSSAKYVAKKINWQIMLFFVGLFVLIAGVRDAGVVDAIGNLFGMTHENVSIGELSIFTYQLSNITSNVPSVALIGAMISPGTPILWTTLSIISSFCANLTLIGAAANLIGIDQAEKKGIRIDFFRHLKIGIPISASTCLIQVGYLYGVSFFLS